MSTSISSIERKIARIQRALAALGPMRPGTLGRQYKDPKARRGAYWQISYTIGHGLRNIIIAEEKHLHWKIRRLNQ